MIRNLLNPMHPCESAVASLLESLKIRYTRSYLKSELQKHSNYPSLLSIADVLGISYNISSASVRMNLDKMLLLDKQSFPFIAHMKGVVGGQVFCVVLNMTKSEVQLCEPATRNISNVPIESFENRFLGTVLLVEAAANSEEKDYERNARYEYRYNLKNRLLLYLLPFFTLFLCLSGFVNDSSLSSSIINIFFTLITLSATLISVLLIWHEVDSYNPALKHICQTGVKVNCSAVLDSRGSKIFNISWSSIGFIYFGGMLLSILIRGVYDVNTFQVLSWFNLAALPYVGYSVYYQWRIIKQWCTLCLVIQALLIIQFILSLVGGFLLDIYSKEWFYSTLVSVGGAFLVIATMTFLFIPVFKKVKFARIKDTDLERLKRNPIIFEALLNKERVIHNPDANLGITIGNVNGKYKIIKVCNPYCAPCATAHPVIHSLAENIKELSVQTIFTATSADKDFRREIVEHLLSIAEKADHITMNKAFDDWYNAKEKDYAEFVKKHPTDENLRLQDDKIEAMQKWVDSNSVKETPTFFLCLNAQSASPTFYQLPRIYKLEDLWYFLAGE